jgi:hypothetical protein
MTIEKTLNLKEIVEANVEKLRDQGAEQDNIVTRSYETGKGKPLYWRTAIHYNHETGLIGPCDAEDENITDHSVLVFEGHKIRYSLSEDSYVSRLDRGLNPAHAPFGEKPGDMILEISLLAFEYTMAAVDRALGNAEDESENIW